MDKKQIFKRVTKHLINQNEKSELNNTCFYWSDNGNKCAVGCLIDEEVYTEDLEESLVSEPHVIEAINKSLNDTITDTDVGLLRDLQRLHDQEEIKDWQFCLNKLSLHWFETPLNNVLQEN